MYKKLMKIWMNTSWINSNNQSYIEDVYKDDCLKDNFFKKTQDYLIHCTNVNILDNNNLIEKKNQILIMINNFRMYGHLIAKTNPLSLNDNIKFKNLELSFYDFNQVDFSNIVLINFFKKKISKFSQFTNFYSILKDIYCSSIGFEYMYINNFREVQWIQNHIEHKSKFFEHNAIKKIEILKNIIYAENFEKYLHYKFPGAKRFSLEGSDVLIPMLQEIINYSKKNSIFKIVIGMAHRGRLNVLINVLKKGLKELFNEFHDNKVCTTRSDDVKYHKGFNYKIIGKTYAIDLTLQSNPSHLEFVNPVIMGVLRGYLESNKNINSKQVLPIMIHGDAAITGQGVVQETLNMSQTKGYSVGGTVHIVINNQIGFTTSNVKNLRSSNYCTDIAKMISAPVFHVNADDPEAAIFVIQLAVLYRSTFNKDVFVDLVSYRRHGHNESDDPSVTQPKLYSIIQKHLSVQNIYCKKLEKLKILNSSFVDLTIQKYRKFLDSAYFPSNKKENIAMESTTYSMINKKNKCFFTSENIQINTLSKLANIINTIPNSINVHLKVKNIYLERLKMARGESNFDWGASETLAYATLIQQGISCRLSGEDVGRGTFFHRHVVICDQITNEKYIPLNNICSSTSKFYICNSVLSETSVLAFEYGYASEAKKTLTIWEAQFGDFSNVAQVIIDQFISSGEQKWNNLCNLVILLPHGYEGQGPEHSSARLERFLQLCAQKNMHITVPTTSAQMYHLLRRQILNKILKPLIIFTPKSMLRNPITFSSLKELSTGCFKEIFNEIDKFDINMINKIIFCTGKFYFDLLIARRQHNINKIVIIRIEELYPFPKNFILKAIFPFLHVKNFIWCQEEPLNQGAWLYVQTYLKQIMPLNSSLSCVCRPSSAAPAVGSNRIHNYEQQCIVKEALNLSF
ncbi:2-oxoglutarate dehydrogenase E1 component [Buchnera aphidicola (Nipponaphis monzeni)]|uniref:oxoglutarate dehydrogenase (succinyl-transferring) n=1 Tax=Buchnera aphidicola (Nipponaphis monzeni) TaxID=2495405 RepID=A0A455TA75_9GAMM|nr:2-oxoglutarate dehydrogenase E1 component [Buchnera aphidicola]BBI01246.1 2-oxoglutarate dehydrogenase E1 component [Buchnera aphidicola (Nipponaphis monzeni)]